MNLDERPVLLEGEPISCHQFFSDNLTGRCREEEGLEGFSGEGVKAFRRSAKARLVSHRAALRE